MRSQVRVGQLEMKRTENRTRDLNSGYIFPIGAEVGESEGNIRPILACNEVLRRRIPFLVEEADGVGLPVSSRTKRDFGNTRDVVACAGIFEHWRIFGTRERRTGSGFHFSH
jgi:hypothetical protein